MKIRLKFCVLMTGLLVLSGCGAQNWKTHDVAKAPVRVPEASAPAQSNARISPLEAHLRARRQVDPKDTRPVHSYTVLASAVKYKPPYPPRKPSRSGARGQFITTQTTLITPPPKPQIYRIPQSVEPATGASLSTPNPAPKPFSAVRSTTAGGAERAALRDVRLGRHPGKSRFVFDLSDKAKFSYVMSADKRELTVRLSNARLQTALSRQYRHDYISSYQASDSGRDTIIRFKMKRPVKLSKWSDLPPGFGQGHRVYFDVEPL